MKFMSTANAVSLIRIILGVNFLWFGALKFFAGLSPAETLAGMTIEALSFGYILPPLSIKLLTVWEVVVSIQVGFEEGRAFCLTMAPSVEAVRRAHEKAGLPYDSITEVNSISPSDLALLK